MRTYRDMHVHSCMTSKEGRPKSSDVQLTKAALPGYNQIAVLTESRSQGYTVQLQ